MPAEKSARPPTCRRASTAAQRVAQTSAQSSAAPTSFVILRDSRFFSRHLARKLLFAAKNCSLTTFWQTGAQSSATTSFVFLRALRGSSFLSRHLARKLLFDNFKRSMDFTHHYREIHRQQRLLRIDDHVRIRRRHRTREPHRLPQPPLHPVALYRSAERTPNRESNAQPRSYTGLQSNTFRARATVLRPRPVENGHGCGKMPPPQLVHALEIGVTQQPRAAGKRAGAGSRLHISFRFSRHTGSHSDSKFPDRYFQVTSATGCRKMSGIAAGGRGFSPRRWTIRGNLVLPRPACAPWRAGGKLLSCRPGSSCAREIRVSSIACAGWVGMYAWAK